MEQGVLFTTEPPQFIYSKVAEEKIEMLAEATKDARARAEQIATQGEPQRCQFARRRNGRFSDRPVARAVH